MNLPVTLQKILAGASIVLMSAITALLATHILASGLFEVNAGGTFRDARTTLVGACLLAVIIGVALLIIGFLALASGIISVKNKILRIVFGYLVPGSIIVFFICLAIEEYFWYLHSLTPRK